MTENNQFAFKVTTNQFNDGTSTAIIKDDVLICSEVDKQIMIYSIEVLNYINNINAVNNLYVKSNSNLRIQTDIFYKAIQSIQTQKAFTDAELKRLYLEINKVEYFYETMNKFIQIDICIPFEAEFILFGLDYATYAQIDEVQKEYLHESYGDNFVNFTIDKISIDEFLIKAKELIEKHKNIGIKEKDQAN